MIKVLSWLLLVLLLAVLWFDASLFFGLLIGAFVLPFYLLIGLATLLWHFPFVTWPLWLWFGGLLALALVLRRDEVAFPARIAENRRQLRKGYGKLSPGVLDQRWEAVDKKYGGRSYAAFLADYGFGGGTWRSRIVFRLAEIAAALGAGVLLVALLQFAIYLLPHFFDYATVLRFEQWLLGARDALAVFANPGLASLAGAVAVLLLVALLLPSSEAVSRGFGFQRQAIRLYLLLLAATSFTFFAGRHSDVAEARWRDETQVQAASRFADIAQAEREIAILAWAENELRPTIVASPALLRELQAGTFVRSHFAAVGRGVAQRSGLRMHELFSPFRQVDARLREQETARQAGIQLPPSNGDRAAWADAYLRVDRTAGLRRQAREAAVEVIASALSSALPGVDKSNLSELLSVMASEIASTLTDYVLPAAASDLDRARPLMRSRLAATPANPAPATLAPPPWSEVANGLYGHGALGVVAASARSWGHGFTSGVGGMFSGGGGGRGGIRGRR